MRLSKTARNLGMSENEYVIKRLSTFIILEPLLQNMGGIWLSNPLFQEIISQLDPTPLQILASEIAINNVPLVFDLLDYDLSSASIIRFMKEILETLGWFKMETLVSETFLDYKLFHKFNKKWSLFVKCLLLSMFEMVHENPEIIFSDKVVKIRVLQKISGHSDEEYELVNAS